LGGGTKVSAPADALGLFVFIHGYQGSPTGRKATAFKKLLYPHRVLAPAVPTDPAEAAPFLEDYIREAMKSYADTDECVLIGSSLGGFYAQHLARLFDLKVALINPVMDPRKTLLADALPESTLAVLDRYRIDPAKKQVPTLLLVELGDEVLDARIAVDAYTDVGRVVTYPGGSHRFDRLDEAVREILRLYYYVGFWSD
jgi:predicted esterase YcpF (UPF0227 family)